MTDSRSFVGQIPNCTTEKIIQLLEDHPEIHHTSPAVCYFVRVKSLYEMRLGMSQVEISIAEIDRLENVLLDVFTTLSQNHGSCHVISKAQPGNQFKMSPFWETFEDQMMKKESALVLARTVFKLVMWLIRSKK